MGLFRATLLRPDAKMHLSFHEDINFAQDLLITSPFNHAYRIAIELNLKLRRHWNETKYGSFDIVLGRFSLIWV